MNWPNIGSSAGPRPNPMNLELIEPHPRRVLEAFREGDFDGIEIIGRADEKAFSELCFRERLLAALADAMPTAREKHPILYELIKLVETVRQECHFCPLGLRPSADRAQRNGPGLG